MSIVTDGKFNIPLYHGTSSLFLESILSSGLGAINPLSALDVENTMRGLVAVADEVLADDSDWQMYRFQFEWMANQDNYGSQCNFQYGDTYVTVSRSRGARYACANRLGSELLSNVEKVWLWIERVSPGSFALPKAIADLLAGSYTPVLFTIPDVPVMAVASEDGGPADKELDHLEFMSELLNGQITGVGFRLLQVLGCDMFSYTQIDAEREEEESKW